MNLTKYEQETINLNKRKKTATVFTMDSTVIRQLDTLVHEYPNTFHCIKETDISKTYEMPKTSITYRKPRRLSDEQREQARQRMKKINQQ